MNDHTIEKQIELKAPVARVWRALTDHEEFGQWFKVKLDGPFVLGGTSRGQMTYPGCEHVRWEAVVQAMEPERLFAFTWPNPEDMNNPHEDLSKCPWTRVDFILTPIPGGTLLIVRESGFEKIPEGRRATAFRQNEGGWAEQMTNIELHVARS